MSERQFTLTELAELTSSTLKGDSSHVIMGVNTLEAASQEEASFLANPFGLPIPGLLQKMKASKAGVICITSDEEIFENKNYLISKEPSFVFQKIIKLLFPKKDILTGFQNIHSTAVIHEKAQIGKNVSIGPYAVIDKDVVIKDDTYIGAHTYIGPCVKIGNECIIHPSCIIREHVIINNRVILQPGAIIGSCGFGYIPDRYGRHIRLEQLGIVVIEDDVEIGANTTIDRARFKETRIRKGTKIDNLVQIAHNVEIGEHNAIAAQTGVAGSAKTRSHVMMGGQVGVLGHVEITDNVLVATRGGVSKSLKKSGKYRGSPAIDINEYNEQYVHIKRLKKYAKQIKELEKRIENLESNHIKI